MNSGLGIYVRIYGITEEGFSTVKVKNSCTTCSTKQYYYPNIKPSFKHPFAIITSYRLLY